MGTCLLQYYSTMKDFDKYTMNDMHLSLPYFSVPCTGFYIFIFNKTIFIDVVCRGCYYYIFTNTTLLSYLFPMEMELCLYAEWQYFLPYHFTLLWVLPHLIYQAKAC